MERSRRRIAVMAGLALALAGIWSAGDSVPVSVAQRPARAQAPALTESVPAPRAERASPVPDGTWEREVGPFRVKIRVEGNRLYGTLTGGENGKKVTCALEADYSVTRDSLVYGVITSFEAQGPDSDTELLSILLVDQPFSLRFRVDDDALTIKDVKFGGIGLKDRGRNDDLGELALLMGRYKKMTR